MSNLVREKRTDKNGVTRTHWVRPSSDTSQRRKPLPAPAAPADKAPVRDRDRITHVLSVSICRALELDSEETLSSVRETLDGYSDGLINRLHVGLRKHGAPLMSAVSLMVYHDETEPFVNEFATFAGVISTGGDMKQAIAGVRAFHSYRQLPEVEDFGAADEKTKQDCRNLLRATATLKINLNSPLNSRIVEYRSHDYDSFDTPVLRSEALVQLIIDRPDDVDRIIDIISDRESDDTDMIKSVLDHGVVSLSEGVL